MLMRILTFGGGLNINNSCYIEIFFEVLSIEQNTARLDPMVEGPPEEFALITLRSHKIRSHRWLRYNKWLYDGHCPQWPLRRQQTWWSRRNRRLWTLPMLRSAAAKRCLTHRASEGICSAYCPPSQKTWHTLLRQLNCRSGLALGPGSARFRDGQEANKNFLLWIGE